MRPRIEISGARRTFQSGLLLDLVAALRATRPGDLIALISGEPSVGPALERWSRLTGHAIVAEESAGPATRWVIRNGPAPAEPAERPLGTRVWLYLNFDCNLRCDYCCVRSSPTAPRRALGLERVRRIARESAPLGVREFFATGGEPFLLPDVADQLRACADVAPTTVLTNGMLFRGSRLTALRALPRDRVTLQISLDSPTPELHDRHRGAGTWQQAWAGIETARTEGFRVRLAATVGTDEEESAFRDFLDRQGIPAADRVIRRIALRGLAQSGIALARRDLVPEITISADGVYWHPVGADDADLHMASEIFPLADAFKRVQAAVEEERAHGARLATIFHCA